MEPDKKYNTDFCQYNKDPHQYSENLYQYNADLYLRLSREDGDGAESESIANQRDLLLAFLFKHPEIHLHKVRVDDGYSGVDYNRPDFRQMMESVKNKEINCIIVKDFSVYGGSLYFYKR